MIKRDKLYELKSFLKEKRRDDIIQSLLDIAKDNEYVMLELMKKL